MKKIVLALFFLIAIYESVSADIVVKSFRKLENDLTARVNEKLTDQNGDLCAIIKIVTTQTGFSFDCGQIGIVKTVNKPSEIWVYVPYGTKRITISHPQLGMLRDYNFPLPIEKATVYEMVLASGTVEYIVKNDVFSQFVIITSIPEGADVYINNEHKGQTPWSMEMVDGDYTFRVSKELYYTEAGKFNLKSADGKKEMNFTLKPNFGFAQIITRPEDGMTVTIDGAPVTQTTPFTTDRLLSGKHRITVSKILYHEQTREVTITDNQTTIAEFDIKPAFGSILIDSKPENGAAVTLDGKETGKVTPFRLDRIVSGEHTLTFRKDWYSPVTTKVQVTDGREENVIADLKPTFGIIKVLSDPESEIYTDNLLKGKGSWEGRMVAGLHTFEARKNKYHPASQKKEVGIGVNEVLTLLPEPMYGELKIVTPNAIGAAIKLDGKDFGKTPDIIRNLLVGDYNLTIQKEGFGTLSRTITINENKTTELNEPLSSGKLVFIHSDPSGAKIIVDGTAYGNTPQQLTLGFGNHNIILAYGNKKTEERFTISQDDSRNLYTFNVKEESMVTLSSNPAGVSLYLNDIYKGTTPLKLSLAYGNYRIRLNKDSKTVNGSISVTPDGETNFMFNVSNEMIVTINTVPAGAKIFINDTYKGDSPLSLSLPYGNHSLKAIKGSKITNDILSVYEGGKSTFDFNLASTTAFKNPVSFKGGGGSKDYEVWNPAILSVLAGYDVGVLGGYNIIAESALSMAIPFAPMYISYSTNNLDYSGITFQFDRWSLGVTTMRIKLFKAMSVDILGGVGYEDAFYNDKSSKYESMIWELGSCITIDITKNFQLFSYINYVSPFGTVSDIDSKTVYDVSNNEIKYTDLFPDRKNFVFSFGIRIDLGIVTGEDLKKK